MVFVDLFIKKQDGIENELKNILSVYKKEFDERRKELSKGEFYKYLAQKEWDIIFGPNRKCVLLLNYEENDYYTLLCDDMLMRSEIDEDISRKLGTICLYVEYHDYEYYEVRLFDKGNEITGFIKDENRVEAVENGKLDLDRFFDILSTESMKKEVALKILESTDVHNSFFDLMEYLNMPLCQRLELTERYLDEYLEKGAKIVMYV